MWKIVSTHAGLCENLDGYKCTCSDGSHDECRGSNTAGTAHYTKFMSEVILDAIYGSAVSAAPARGGEGGLCGHACLDCTADASCFVSNPRHNCAMLHAGIMSSIPDILHAFLCFCLRSSSSKKVPVPQAGSKIVNGKLGEPELCSPFVH